MMVDVATHFSSMMTLLENKEITREKLEAMREEQLDGLGECYQAFLAAKFDSISGISTSLDGISEDILYNHKDGELLALLILTLGKQKMVISHDGLINAGSRYLESEGRYHHEMQGYSLSRLLLQNEKLPLALHNAGIVSSRILNGKPASPEVQVRNVFFEIGYTGLFAVEQESYRN